MPPPIADRVMRCWPDASLDGASVEGAAPQTPAWIDTARQTPDCQDEVMAWNQLGKQIVAWSPRSQLQQLILEWHQQLPSSTRFKYLQGIRRLASSSALESGMGWWSLCAGTGIIPLFLRSYRDVLEGYYGISLPLEQKVFCEKHKQKQQWLRQQQVSLADGQAHLIDEMQELHLSTALDRRDASNPTKAILPHCFGQDAGVPCQSRVPLNKNAAQNIGCVKRGEGTTGIGIAHAYGAADAHRAEIVSWECTDKLCQEDIRLSQPDSAWMVQQFENKGYTSFDDSDNAKDWGSALTRWRRYWLAMLLGHAPKEMVRQFVQEIRAGFKMASRPLQSCITIDDEVRAREAKEMAVAEHHNANECKGDSGSKDECRWPVDHKAYFERLGVPWPLQDDVWDDAHSEIRPAGLNDRQRQMCLAADLFWPPHASGPALQFLDVNPDSRRAIWPHLRDDGWPKEESSPWRNEPNTLTGSGRPCVRTRKGTERPVIRIMEAFEEMRLIGWFDDMWQAPLPEQETLYLCSNMAGNA